MVMTNTKNCGNVLGHHSRYVIEHLLLDIFVVRGRVIIDFLIMKTQLLMEVQQNQPNTQWSKSNTWWLNYNFGRSCIIYDQVKGPYDLFFMMHC